MDNVELNENPTTYVVVTRGGANKIAYGTLRIFGDYVVIGDTNIFYKPDSVKQWEK